MALSAFARHTLLLLSAGYAAIDQYLLPAGHTAAAGLLLWAHAGTDWRMDRGTMDGHRTVTQTLLHTYYVGSAHNQVQYCNLIVFNLLTITSFTIT